jgi:hypothetical protein
LQDLGARLTHMPSDFTFHRVVKTVYENRAKSIKNNAGIDWFVTFFIYCPFVFCFLYLFVETSCLGVTSLM